MKKIAFINLKGGVGKTTTTANFGHNLAKEGYNVLLGDCDKQGNLTRLFRAYFYEKSMKDILIRNAKVCEAILPISERFGEMYLIPADINLLSANQQLTRPDILAEALKAVEENYDYCLLDCPPNIDMVTLNVLECADEVIIPIKVDGFAEDGIKDILEQIEGVRIINPNIVLRGCLVTSYKKSAETIKELSELKKQFKIFKTVIPYTQIAINASIEKRILDEYSPRCGAAKGYREFTKEYLEE